MSQPEAEKAKGGSSLLQLRFAEGMEGTESLGEDITMKGDRFHYVAKGELPICNGTNGKPGVDCRAALHQAAPAQEGDAKKAAFGQEPVKSGSGDHLPVCNGVNDGRCVEAHQVAQVQGDDTGAPLQICNGTNSHNCIEEGEMKKRAEALVQWYLPTCTDQTTVNCQPTCTEKETTGCTEARTPNWPERDRFEGKWTHK